MKQGAKNEWEEGKGEELVYLGGEEETKTEREVGWNENSLNKHMLRERMDVEQ